MASINEATELQSYLEKIVRKIIRENEKPCLRLYKATVYDLPYTQKGKYMCQVKLIGEDEPITVLSPVSDLYVDEIVWVGTVYDSFSNAFIFSNENMIPYTYAGNA